ncbi:hypothetical protein ACFLX0_03675 [Chloroflexota bacterium]
MTLVALERARVVQQGIYPLILTSYLRRSSPVPPTISPVLFQKDSPVLEILELLYGPELKRRLIVEQLEEAGRKTICDTVIARHILRQLFLRINSNDVSISLGG